MLNGTLFICGTPIGNLEDITMRVIRILSEVSIIACEDTRHTLKLLNHFNISNSLTSYHEHNKIEKGNKILEILKSGRNVALVSDAGMPCISDPGYELVELMYENDIDVTVVPSGTAVTSAIALSGINSKRFIFEGFLPRNKKERNEILNLLLNEKRTVVFYESPHHLISTLNDMFNTLGNRSLALLRELTKKFEEVIRGDLETIINMNIEPKGEYVIIVQGISLEESNKIESEKWINVSIEEHIKIYEDKGFTKSVSIKQVAKDRNVSKSTIYNAVMRK